MFLTSSLRFGGSHGARLSKDMKNLVVVELRTNLRENGKHAFETSSETLDKLLIYRVRVLWSVGLMLCLIFLRIRLWYVS